MIRLFEYKVYPKTEEPIPFCWKVLFVLFMLGTLLAMAAVCSSCQPEEEGMEDVDMEDVDMEEGMPATIRVEVQGEEQVNFVTRTVNESVISDLHILIYNSVGELIGHKYQTGGSTVTINTRSATGCTIYAVANTGKADLFKGYVIHEESYLKSMVYSITDWGDLTHGTNLLMTGSMKSVDIKAGTHTLSAKLVLTRMVAKVVLNIKVQESSGITITNYSVKNIPARSYYVARASEDAVQTATAAHWKESGVITTSGATSVSKTFYMFENRRGTKTISAQKDKTTANAPANATYVVIHGLVGSIAVTWTVYLGENNTSDFNIKRNGNYTYNITLNDNALADTRITMNSTGVIDLSSSGTANCYLASQTNTWYRFNATVRGNGIVVGKGDTTADISPIGGTSISPNGVELIWESDSPQPIIQGLLLQDGYVFFKTGESKGNALIAVKKNDEILWSWHVWHTDGVDLAKLNSEHVISTITYLKRNIYVMDRNLGASFNGRVTYEDCIGPNGLYYQFGRKDPFPGEYATRSIHRGGKMNAEAAGSNVKSIIAQTMKTPWIFFTDSEEPYNWISTDTVGSADWQVSNCLWGDNNVVENRPDPVPWDSYKTIYDPCPLGWRVAPADTWTEMLKIPYESSAWLSYDFASVNAVGSFFKGFTINVTGGTIFLPASGNMSFSDATINSLGTHGYGWLSSPGGITTSFAAGLGFSNGLVGIPNGNYRVSGFPVRCVKE